jgi:hypothetical protein
VGLEGVSYVTGTAGAAVTSAQIKQHAVAAPAVLSCDPSQEQHASALCM